MAFTLPIFNLAADVWTAGHTPAADPPDVLALPTQLYLTSRGLLDITPGSVNLWVPPVFLRVPIGIYTPVRGDIAEVVPGSADFYKVRWTQSTHRGFPNEYLSVLVEQCDATGATPRP